MKKIHTTMMVCLMSGVVMLAAGCKREFGTVTLGANIDNGRDAKVYINDLTPCWHNNDWIRVNNQTCTTSVALGASAQITNVVESNHYRAIYPADIVGNVNISGSNTVTVTLPREQQYEVDSRGDQKVKVPMGAYSSNESLTFHNLCSLIKVVVSNQMTDDFLLDCIKVTATSAYLSGGGNAIVSGNSNDVISLTSSSSNHDVSLVFPTANRPTIGRGDRDTYVFYIIVPEFTDDDVIITLYSQGRYTTFERQASLPHNRMAEVRLTLRQWDGVDPSLTDGVLPGVFSVSNTQQICFSRGNLQYCASTETWRFAEHQWDFVGTQTADNRGYYGGTIDGCDNRDISSTYSGWIDLFGWGTSGWWNSGAVCNQPWDTSTIYSYYSPGDSYNSNLTGDYAEADWAWHNSISNGGNATHLWRTLSTDEWSYLISGRTNASYKYGVGTIYGVSGLMAGASGLIILPDNWTMPSGCNFYSYYTYRYNSYTQAQWSKMEANGAVFLPTAGQRWGISVELTGRCGFYWSSSYSSEPNARSMYFSHSNSWSGAYPADELRCYGCSVRPVRDNN